MATLQANRRQEASKHKTLTDVEWREAVQGLADQVTDWCRQEGWTVERQEAQVLEGRYYPPTLVIQSPDGRLMLELPDPMEHAMLRPKLYAWPALFRVWLEQISPQGGWEVWADSRIPLRRPWGRETFVTLAQDLLGADE